MLRKKKILILIISILGIVLVAFLTALIIKKVTTVGDADRAKLNDFTNKTLIYLGEYDAEESQDDENIRLALFAVMYNYGEKGETELSFEDAKQIVKESFNKELEEPRARMISTGESELSKYVRYNLEQQKFILDRSSIGKREITKIPLWFYQEKDAKKHGQKIVVKYQKYKIANPYDIFNYAAVNQKDIPELADYLRGEGSYAPITRAISNEEISEISQFVKDLTITYKISEDKLYIDSIK